MSIEIKIHLARLKAKPPLVALADVILLYPEGAITIHRCAVFEKSDQPPWAALPRIPVEKHGRRTYVSFIEMAKELERLVLAKILAEFTRQCDADRS
jgi:hypothetical protein